jgi:hypothetical protein
MTKQEHVMNAYELFLKVINAAEQHGIDSGPDHEVGDLQDALEEALKLLTPEQLEVYEKRLHEVFPEEVA